MFDIDSAQVFFSLLRERFEKEEENLNHLDASIGDGDHGSTVARSFYAAEAATRGSFSDLGSLFDSASQALAEHAGGAIGPLLAAFFSEAGTIFAGRSEANSSDFVRFLKGGLEAVQEIGGGKPGDKTIIDTLLPALNAISPCMEQPLDQALLAIVKPAWDGAESTTGMLAVHGRAHFLAARSLGHQDPGASSMAIILETFSDSLTGRKPELIGKNQKAKFVPPPGKFINSPETTINEDIEGVSLAYPKLVSLSANGILVRSQPKTSGKVGLAIGHGGGHTPSMAGFLGPGLLDADVYGPLFTCASGIRIAQAIKLADRGAGVVLLVSNHSGDVLNARLAVRRAQEQGILVQPVYLGDDIATASRERFMDRRGLGGMLFALKTGGALAEAGKDLSKVVDIMKKTNERTATLSVSVRAATHPWTGMPLFELPDGQIEVGTGVHGEVGVYRGNHLPADEITDMLIDKLVSDLNVFSEKSVLIFVNGAGGTSKMELHIIFRRAYQNLVKRGFQVEAGVVDSLFTTQEMGGVSISLCAVDDELLKAWHEPANGSSFRWPYFKE